MSTCNQDAILLKILLDFNSKNGESLILGDFNAPAIDWQARSCSAMGSFSDHLLEFAELGRLFQGITFPSRFRTGTSPSTLELAFFGVPDGYSQVSRLSPIGLRDYAVVKFIFKWQTSTSNEMFRPRRWNYCKLYAAKLTGVAEELNWTETTRDDSVEEQWANTKNILSLRN